MYLMEIKGSSLIKVHLNPTSMAGDWADLSLGSSSKTTFCNTKTPGLAHVLLQAADASYWN